MCFFPKIVEKLAYVSHLFQSVWVLLCLKHYTIFYSSLITRGTESWYFPVYCLFCLKKSKSWLQWYFELWRGLMDKSMNFLWSVEQWLQLEEFWKVSVVLVKKLPYLSCGKVLLSYGKDWSSVKCQWNIFILFISIKSKLAMITDLDKKCLEESNITPRWVNRGKSITCVEFTKYWKMRKMVELRIRADLL